MTNWTYLSLNSASNKAVVTADIVDSVRSTQNSERINTPDSVLASDDPKIQQTLSQTLSFIPFRKLNKP